MLLTFILLVAGYLALERRFAMLGLVLAATLGGMVLSGALKSLFARPRPTVVPPLAMVGSASFPSGHSMIAAVVYLTLGALLARTTTRAGGCGCTISASRSRSRVDRPLAHLPRRALSERRARPAGRRARSGRSSASSARKGCNAANVVRRRPPAHARRRASIAVTAPTPPTAALRP